MTKSVHLVGYSHIYNDSLNIQFRFYLSIAVQLTHVMSALCKD